ncbi:hypothetical protein D8682_03405 [Buttiauxella sp. 3AFRM03]|nr:hypothetical protein D8682_03405 [Buttiauxella sp. 3AFRM03]
MCGGGSIIGFGSGSNGSGSGCGLGIGSGTGVGSLGKVGSLIVRLRYAVMIASCSTPLKHVP